ncbi:hypothetical protein [Algoriphagus machipongonensis]|uniref:Uncharacterized protein n=1 Tax=Algoriphagus machipongonensis TaxID=388413 RepID=A3HSC0_9BACT|nr:hypothetical protein [Algoriphagus machipongonensis]EAZ82738.1 hypothetical protein ALPR1_10995 [Algoriphagus machipongonensis]
MSISQSDLSNPHYGYDFVVATTQESINATMDEYMSTIDSPEVSICYIMDPNGNPKQIDYQTLIKQANGTDPFSVPNKSDPSSTELQNLAKAFFYYGFKAKIGLPNGYAPLSPGGPSLPNIVTLGANTATVSYNLLSSEFTVVEAQYGPRGIIGWLNESQPAGKAWVFSSKVDLRLGATSEYSKLPPSVQAKIKNIGGNAFSVQQLLFDLDNAALESIPTISGVEAGTPLYTALESSFIGAYFSKLKESGEPVLSYSITQSTTPSSTLVLTDLNMEVQPVVGSNGLPVSSPTLEQQKITTLCYLCAANNKPLPAASPFTWNWIEESDALKYNGALAIKRDTFSHYIKNELITYIRENCYKVYVKVWMDGLKCKYKGELTGGQNPNITFPSAGEETLKISYSSSDHDQAGLDGDMGKMKVDTSYTVSVTFSSNTIVIEQHLVLYLYIRSLQSSKSGNVFDKKITDTYSLEVGQNGELTANKTTKKVDHSVKLKANWFINLFTGLNDLLKNFEDYEKTFGSSSLKSIPITFAQDFFFPGGKTFSFQDIEFSKNQDLVSHINYVEPS